MHGLLNRSIQNFLSETYGREVWQEISAIAECPSGFEALLSYDDEITLRLLNVAQNTLNKPIETLLEDLGTYLVASPSVGAVRRLLRFGGDNFTDFLYSLDDLQGRAHLAVPDMGFPKLDIRSHTFNAYTLSCTDGHPYAALILLGVLRAMADEYGALVMLDHLGQRAEAEVISIEVHESSFADARSFDLVDTKGAAA